jgi:outer membrane PBP1 activator LpoA protein
MMLHECMKILLLAGALGGLCSCAQVNTIVAGAPRSAAPAASAAAPGGLPYTPPAVAKSGMPVPPAIPGPVPLPSSARSSPQKPLPVRIGLLLPLQSAALSQAANVVRDGFFASYERDKDERLSIHVIQTGDAVRDVLSGYLAAALDYDIVVGPLTRSGVTAIAQRGMLEKPTIALTQVDMPADADIALPSKLMVMGLSAEDEARQVAQWVHADYPSGKVFIISTSTAWQRRAAKAFAIQWRRLGGAPESLELGMSGGYLSASGLVQLKNRIHAENPTLLFVALDAAQTGQLREAIGHDIEIYGTSQLNPHALPDWNSAERMPHMNGVHLVDIPWQLQPEHPAVMVYPRLAVNADQKRDPDLERLYALGIDAYRVAKEIAANRTRFTIDGVTGRLSVDFDESVSRFERTEVPAMYQDGVVVPLDGAR